MYYRFIDVIKVASDDERQHIETVEKLVTRHEIVNKYEAQSVLIATWANVRPYQSYFDKSKVNYSIHLYIIYFIIALLFTFKVI